MSLSQLLQPLGNDGEHHVQVHIFFGKFRETTYKVVPTLDPYQVVSNIGGAMGVFLGASLITCMEFLAFLWKLFVRKICTRTDPVTSNREAMNNREESIGHSVAIDLTAASVARRYTH